MKSLLEDHLQESLVKICPKLQHLIRLQQKKYADYTLEGLPHLARQMHVDVQTLSDRFCSILMQQEGVLHVEIEKSCYLNIFIDAKKRYFLIFERILDLKMHSSLNNENIHYVLMRLQLILQHLPFESKPIYPSDLRIEECHILNCLDELLSVLQVNNAHEISKLLNELANNIHGYLQVITLLCEDKSRYQFQIQLLKLCDLMLRNGILVSNK